MVHVASGSSTRRHLIAAAYIATVTVSALVATIDPNHPRPLWFAATVVLCLPAFVPALPAFFVIVGTAWNLTGADHGGTGWPVTATYVGVFACVAVANSWIIGRLARVWSDRRSGPVSADAATAALTH